MAADRKTANVKMTRRAIREAVFKLLFISEFNSADEMKEQQDIFFDGVGSDLLPNADNAVPREEDANDISRKFENVKNVVSEIDSLLNETAQGWKTTRMNRVDLNVLRLAVYEMLYDDSIPVGVAINEAVELSKKFGGEDSGSFINGVLGKIAKAKAKKE